MQVLGNNSIIFHSSVTSSFLKRPTRRQSGSAKPKKRGIGKTLELAERMNSVFSGSLIFFASCFIVYGPYAARAAASSSVQHEDNLTSTAVWTSSHAQHVYGLPDAKPGDRGVLRLDARGLSFAGESADFSVERHSIIALSARSERVELWGSKGRLLRMLIPFSGGLAVAAVTHHRVDELTVEFRDSGGGYHGAVFLLPPGDAERALQRSGQFDDSGYGSPGIGCGGQQAQPGSVLIQLSRQPHTNIPAAYSALVYEHLLDRLRDMHGIRVVYREGRGNDHQNCSQFRVQVVITDFQPGSQVLRASTGPIGMFMSPTVLKMDATFFDNFTGQRSQEHFRSTVRDDSESRKVAEKAAKLLARHFSSAMRRVDNSHPGESE